MGRQRQKRGWQQQFAGFRANCENFPRLPAWVVGRVMDDPRHIPYLLLWRNGDSEVREALRVIWQAEDEWVEVKRPDGSGQRIRTGRVATPNGGQALMLHCPDCGVQRRHLYGYSVSFDRVTRSLWTCRSCAGLRYRSEGFYVPLAFRPWGRRERKPWDPQVVSNSVATSEVGLGLT